MTKRGWIYGAVLALAACGGGGSTPPTTDPTDEQRALAARDVAESLSNACGTLRPFYWETGDGTAVKASGSVTPVGGTAVTRDTSMAIASATKWLYGAYVAQKKGGTLTAPDIQFLSFRSGHTLLNFCTANQTVGECALNNNNDVAVLAHEGKFYYAGGHMQTHAAGSSLNALANAALASEIKTTLGWTGPLSFSQPLLAGGAVSTAGAYATFLQKILRRELHMATLLGSHAVCTNPATCADALSTPATGLDWHYSIGHWVEDDPTKGDGAFSSAGAFGFYPWIDPTQKFYGVLARLDLPGSGMASSQCGALIRKAWLTGKPV